jgi:hypothetical protein
MYNKVTIDATSAMLLITYCSMSAQSKNFGARETAIAGQRPCKQAKMPTLGIEPVSNNGGTIWGGVFYEVRADAI